MPINNWRATYNQDYMLDQINALMRWNKTPEQVRAENDLYPLPSGDSPVITQRWPGEVNPRPVVTNTAAPYTAGPVITQRWPGENSSATTNTQQPSFSNADVYRLQSQGYYDQWNTALWDAYNALWKWSNAYSNTANEINNFYSQLWDDIYRREMALAWAKQALADRLYEDMWQTKQYALNMFWPDGQLTREVNKYYDDLWNYLATDAGRKAAEIAAQWMHSWASLWAIRAQQNQAYNDSFSRYVQAKEQEINAKQTIASNLINYMSTLRKEYWDTTNQYIIQQYQRANDLLNSLSKNIADSNIQLAQTRLKASLWWWKSNKWYSYLDALTQAYLMKELWLTDNSEDSGIHSNDNLNK